MLETMRAYAHEHLQHAGTLDEVRERHAHCIGDIIQRLALRSLGPDELAAYSKVVEFLPDALAALDWCIEHRMWQLGIRLAPAMYEGELREIHEMIGLLRDAIADSEGDQDLRDELARTDKRLRGHETVAASVERGLRSIRSVAELPSDRVAYPPYTDFQYGGFETEVADEIVTSLERYDAASDVVRYLAGWGPSVR